VKHENRQLYKLKKTTEDNRVFMQILSTLQKVLILMRFIVTR